MSIAQIAYALASAWSADFQQIVRYSETLFCRQEFRRPDRLLVVAELETDKEHRVLGRTLRLSNRSFRANWQPAAGRDLRSSPRAIEPRAIALPHGTPFPVTVTLRYEGVAVWHRTFAERTEDIMVVPAERDAPRAGFQAGLSFVIDGADAPPLFGVDNADLIVTSASGEAVLTRPLVMPDWLGLETDVIAAFATIEAARQRRVCSPNASITIID